MRALDKKLLRDFKSLWAQALAIALVMSCGVAVIIISIGAARSLEDTRSAFYERQNFASVFATANQSTAIGAVTGTRHSGRVIG